MKLYTIGSFAAGEKRHKGLGKIACFTYSNTHAHTFAFLHPLTAGLGGRGWELGVRCGWGGVRQSSLFGLRCSEKHWDCFHYWGKWNSRGWLPAWRREETSWITLFWGERVKGGNGREGDEESEEEQEGDAVWLYFPNKTPNKCARGCLWV